MAIDKNIINRETDARFWASTNYKPGKKLDPKDPADAPYIKIWNDTHAKVQREADGGKLVTTYDHPVVAQNLADAEVANKAAAASLDAALKAPDPATAETHAATAATAVQISDQKANEAAAQQPPTVSPEAVKAAGQEAIKTPPPATAPGEDHVAHAQSIAHAQGGRPVMPPGGTLSPLPPPPVVRDHRAPVPRDHRAPPPPPQLPQQPFPFPPGFPPRPGFPPPFPPRPGFGGFQPPPAPPRFPTPGQLPESEHDHEHRRGHREHRGHHEHRRGEGPARRMTGPSMGPGPAMGPATGPSAGPGPAAETPPSPAAPDMGTPIPSDTAAPDMAPAPKSGGIGKYLAIGIAVLGGGGLLYYASTRKPSGRSAPRRSAMMLPSLPRS